MTANVTAAGPGWLVPGGSGRDSTGLDRNSWALVGAGRPDQPENRFFSGRPTSLEVTLKILAALGLQFEEVATPIEDKDDHLDQGKDDPQGESSIGAVPKPTPHRSPPDLSLRLDGGFAQ